MTTCEATIRYDGPALGQHKMDVDDIAPAMIALSQLCKQANELENGERVSVRLLINADVEQHCFRIRLEIVQTWLDRAKGLLDDDHVSTAKNICEWVGIIGSSALGLFGLLKALRGRKPSEVKMVVRDGANVCQIHTGGGDVYLAHPQAVRLMEQTSALQMSKKVVLPVTKDGYDSISFEDNDRPIAQITQEEAKLIQTAEPLSVKQTETVIPESTIRAKVRIRRAVYEGQGQWTIQYDRSREVGFEDHEWLRRFQSRELEAPPGSLLDVDIEVSSIKVDSNGDPIEQPTYKILKVHGVELPATQIMLPGER